MAVVERWRQSPSFPSYEISNLGRVRNWKRDTLMNQSTGRKDRSIPTFYLRKAYKQKSQEVRISVLMEETWPTSSSLTKRKP